MEMLGGVDIRVASEHATFGVLEPARGLFAGGGTTVRLPRQIPFAQAMEFLLCADIIDAGRAFEMGLLNAVVPEEQLMDKAFEYAARIVKNAPLAIQATKRSVLEGLKLDLREAYRKNKGVFKAGNDYVLIARSPRIVGVTTIAQEIVKALGPT